MASDIASISPSDDDAAAAATSPAEPARLLAALTYRSRAARPLAELELHRLAKAAQLRNRCEGVTGLMVYASGWFFQRLEGPPAGLARIWDSIRRDPRHAELCVLGDAPTPVRQFVDWDLKLSVHGAGDGIAADPPELIERLCRGEPAAALPLAARPRGGPGEALQSLARVRAADALAGSRASLADLIARVVLPRLCAEAPARPAEPPSPAVGLARLLIGVDAVAAYASARAAHAASGSLDAVALELLEPAARCLGDLWQADACSELDLTLGLVRLQAILHRLGAEAPRLEPASAPVVIVVPLPGEAHLLGASFDAELLWHAGWEPRIDFPASSDALDALLAAAWVDVLDLSLSPSFRREHCLPQLGRTIASARLASLNPDLVVVVSGRVFGDRPEAPDATDPARQFGADASFASAALAESTILQVLQRPAAGARTARHA